MRANFPESSPQRTIDHLDQLEVPSIRGGILPGSRKESFLSSTNARYEVIETLETVVTRLQVTEGEIGRIIELLRETKEFLEEKGTGFTQGIISSTVINNYIREQLTKIDAVIEEANFQGQKLLNGESGVQGTTSEKSLRFVRGSARVVSSVFPGYPVSVYQAPTPSTLIGAVSLTQELIQQESLIFLKEEKNELRYKIKEDETPDSLIQNLQKDITESGLNLRVERTEKEELCFIHNQLGSAGCFQGGSLQTKLISQEPGTSQVAEKGKDIIGTIGREQARGIGGFLVGNRGNPKTDGLILYFDGEISFSGQIVGYIHVKQNGYLVPVDQIGESVETLSIPSLKLEHQAVGVPNHSGFTALDTIHGNTTIQNKDALKMIIWALADLEHLLDELQSREDCYVKRTITILQGGARPLTAGEEIMGFSEDQAGEMADQLKSMLAINSD